MEDLYMLVSLIEITRYTLDIQAFIKCGMFNHKITGAAVYITAVIVQVDQNSSTEADAHE